MKMMKMMNSILKMVMLVGVGVVLCVALHHSSNHLQFYFGFGGYNINPIHLLSSSSVSEYVKLNKVLKKADMGNNTVIITTLNDAWARPGSIFDLFVESFKNGNQTQRFLKHLVVAAFDKNSYARCLQLQLNCYALVTDGVDFSGQAVFMTDHYLKMMWRRIDFLRLILEMEYNFVFTDADILWFRDPFPQFHPEDDFQIACDKYLGNPNDLSNAPNGGFNYVKSNNKTVAFYRFWYDSRINHPGKHDQDVLNLIKRDAFLSDQIGIKMRFLDTVYFGGICEPSRDFNLVCTMHANCCVGLGNKIHDLKVMLEDWRNYYHMQLNNATQKNSSWRIPQFCAL